MQSNEIIQNIAHDRSVTDPDWLVCPVCGFEYTCIYEVEIFPMPDGLSRLIVNRHGMSVVPVGEEYRDRKKRNLRGTEIIRRFCCEEGHAWDIEERFSKGNTQTITRRRVDKEVVAGTRRLRPIWRD